MEFVKKIEEEGVMLEGADMGIASDPKSPIVIEIDKDNVKKNIALLDIQIPMMTPRIRREYQKLDLLNKASYEFTEIILKDFELDENVKEISFENAVNKTYDHDVKLITIIPSATNIIGFHATNIMKELRLFNGYDILYGKVKEFVKYYLF